MCSLLFGRHGPLAPVNQNNLSLASADMFFLEVLPVSPTRFRPPAKMGEMLFEHPQNELLSKVLTTSYRLRDLNNNLRAASVKGSNVDEASRRRILQSLLDTLIQLQVDVNSYIDSSKNPTPIRQGRLPPAGVKQGLEKKEGLFRKHMMGKRVNYAARSVISPDVNIEPNEIGIPPVFARKLTFPEPVTPNNFRELRQLVITGPHGYPGATMVEYEDGHLHFLDKLTLEQRTAIANQLLTPQDGSNGTAQRQSLYTSTPAINKKVYRHLRDGDILILNRQPTLHKPSMMCHKARVLHGEKTIRMHYANCNSYNADFDGDEMNIHFPQNHVARAEAYYIANTDNQYLVPTSGKPLRGLIQDHVVAGVWMTAQDAFFTREEYFQLLYGALRPEGGDVIGWLNDFENDARYERWGGTLRILLRQMYPGQFPSVKLNMFNVVLAVDLSQASSIEFIGMTVNSLINRGLPFRWGVVPLVETEDGARMARLFYYLVDNFGSDETLNFVLSLTQRNVPLDSLKPSVDWSTVRLSFNRLLAAQEELDEDIEKDLDVILEGSEGDLEKPRAYARRLGASLSTAPQGHVFVNGKHFDLDDEFLRLLQTEYLEQLQHIQMKVYKGELTDEDAGSISTYFYDLPTTAKRRNTYIHPTQKAGSLRIFALPELIEKNGLNSTAGAFIYPLDSEQVLLTTYIVADLDSEGSREIIKEALKSIIPGSLSRLSFIHAPSAASSAQDLPETAPSHILGRLIAGDALSKVTPEQLLDVLGLSEPLADGTQRPLSHSSIEELLADLPGSGAAYEKYLNACRLIVRQLELKPGEQAIVINGRLVGPMPPGEFLADDFETLIAFEHHRRVQPAYEALSAVHEAIHEASKEDVAELVSIVSSIIASIQQPDPSEVGLFNAPQRPRLRNYRRLSGTYTYVIPSLSQITVTDGTDSAFTIGDNTTALYHVGALIDPLSESAQKWTSLLEWLAEIPGVFIEVHVNPARSTELPLKRFYRYNLIPRLTFDEHGNEMRASTRFTGLPTEPIYTLAMDAPQSWLIRPKEAVYDLDNIQLGLLSPQDRVQGLKAVFDLDYLVIEGHAREGETNTPPRGLQMQLVTSDSTPIADTLVMANLGYLQFRTKPGVYKLEIRPGRGRDIFKMESVGNEGWNSPPVDEAGDEVTVTSFEGVTLYPRLARNPGMEREDVLMTSLGASENHESVLDNFVNKVSSLFGGKKEEKAVVAVDDGQAEINIFTVASGHLYERFASIMILSVLRHTKSSVKFWFIDNFLSPSFLEFLPHFAAEYGFQYELVTYKWPSWLRAQTEKQRIIWAYKILFLDVLFPMDLKKVIFVDADQIVRADLKELVELDLHGAPYGYVPMGDDNPDTEGFRFWKTGYWKDFLRGMPYHISALYVVDLVRFRQMAAGDILRGHYQQLSADPNSLANLDQDLPNNLQREVPIYSLPEDWLWCETWCMHYTESSVAHR
ncbi:hypothetical protein NUW54_g6613 [Trametes sanguinea]|uniref:Uncharacterized protein n=1 Tax=Trametes sanguinea TaxID=158606 RepID=A0ACC1PRU4_9APHY|nr:hypothetical protein NUW54_g6613 [Trametes sanguinea]